MVVSLFMGWRHVCFANWPVDPELVRPQLPERLTLDTDDGQAWLSVVPFTNVDVRPRVFPAGTGVALPELNLRTYVTVDGTPGVYFFSLDADGILAVVGARVFHHLPYYYADVDLIDDNIHLTDTDIDLTDADIDPTDADIDRTDADIDPTDADIDRTDADIDRTDAAVDRTDADIDLVEEHGRIRFRCRRRHPGARPVAFDATYGPSGDRIEVESDTLAHFLTERYRYYTEAPDGSIRYADIQHEPWPVYDADVEIAENTLFEANGFASPETDPVHLYSPGVETIASRSKRIR